MADHVKRELIVTYILLPQSYVHAIVYYDVFSIQQVDVCPRARSSYI